MDPERGPYHVAQTQSSDIDPRLQEPTQTSQTYSNPAAQDTTSSHFKLPVPPPQQQQQQIHPHPQFGAPPQWPQEGYDSFYGSQPGQQPSPATQISQHQDHGYQHYQSGSPSLPGDGNFGDSKRPRACEACRGLKVRCEPDPGNGPCKRCAKANRNCVITPPSRKRQKKTDSRVAELERKLDQLRQEVNANKGVSEDEYYRDREISQPGLDVTAQQQPSPYSTLDGSDRKRHRSEYQPDGYSSGAPQEIIPLMAGRKFAPSVPNMIPQPTNPPHSTQLSSLPTARGIEGPVHGNLDVVDRGVLSSVVAKELFTHYVQNMVPHMPIVIFPVNATCEAVRKTKPILFLAIMSVASSQDFHNTQAMLNSEIMGILSGRIIGSGEKSIELVQALQVIAIWYWPEPKGNSKYYQFIHMATVMAMDLRIDRKPRSTREQDLHSLGLSEDVYDTETAECKRAWLGCYLLSSVVAMGKKQPGLVRPTAYLEDCITNLRPSQDSVESDRILVHWVRLQVLADELIAQIPQDAVNVVDGKVRSAYRTFEKQLKDWEDAEKSIVNESLTLSLALNAAKLYMHELITLHEIYSDSPKTLRARGKNQSQAPLSAQIVSPDTTFVATLGILDTFARLDIQQIRTLPVFQFAQIAHATISLVKTYFVAKSDPRVNKYAPITSERIEQYTNHLVESLGSASADGKLLGPHTFLMVFVTIQKLFVEHKGDTLEGIRTRYGCIPDTTQHHTVDSDEPTSMAQRRGPRRNGESSDEALHLLSEVAMGKSGSNGYTLKEAQSGTSTEQRSALDDMAAMGKLIGEGDIASMSDDALFGIIQRLWARSS